MTRVKCGLAEFTRVGVNNERFSQWGHRNIHLLKENYQKTIEPMMVDISHGHMGVKMPPYLLE